MTAKKKVLSSSDLVEKIVNQQLQILLNRSVTATLDLKEIEALKILSGIIPATSAAPIHSPRSAFRPLSRPGVRTITDEALEEIAGDAEFEVAQSSEPSESDDGKDQ